MNGEDQQVSQGLGMYVGRQIKLIQHAKYDNERARVCMIKSIVWALWAKKYSTSILNKFTYVRSSPTIAVVAMPAKPT